MLTPDHDDTADCFAPDATTHPTISNSPMVGTDIIRTNPRHESALPDDGGDEHGRGRRGPPEPPLYRPHLNQPYLLDYVRTYSGRRLGSSKRRRVSFIFGFSSLEAIERGSTGADCRGREHEVVYEWSPRTGKRVITADGNEVHYSVVAGGGVGIGRRRNNAAGAFDVSWTMEGGHELRFIASSAASAAVVKGRRRRFDLTIDGRSAFDLPRVYELGGHRHDDGGIGSGLGSSLRDDDASGDRLQDDEDGYAEKRTASAPRRRRIRRSLGLGLGVARRSGGCGRDDADTADTTPVHNEREDDDDCDRGVDEHHHHDDHVEEDDCDCDCDGVYARIPGRRTVSQPAATPLRSRSEPIPGGGDDDDGDDDCEESPSSYYSPYALSGEELAWARRLGEHDVRTRMDAFGTDGFDLSDDEKEEDGDDGVGKDEHDDDLLRDAARTGKEGSWRGGWQGSGKEEDGSEGGGNRRGSVRLKLLPALVGQRRQSRRRRRSMHDSVQDPLNAGFD